MFLKNAQTGKIKASKDIKIFYSTNVQVSKKNLPPLIFNYGLVCSHEHFRHQIEFFDSLGYPIVLHDYRFHYNSDSKASIKHCTLKNICHDLLTLLDELKLNRVILVGHSMGVNISLEFSKMFPQRVQKNILISGTVLPPHDVMFDSNLMDITLPIIINLREKIPQTFNLLWKYSHFNPLIRKIVHMGGFNTQCVPDEFVKIYLKKISELKPELFFKLFDEMGKQNILPYLSKIKVPNLIIGGDKDFVIPNYLQRILSENLPHSELYIVKDGSHVPQWDFPNMINERMLKFVQDPDFLDQ